jgi:hypothetical protein
LNACGKIGNDSEGSLKAAEDTFALVGYICLFIEVLKYVRMSVRYVNISKAMHTNVYKRAESERGMA